MCLLVLDVSADGALDVVEGFGGAHDVPVGSGEDGVVAGEFAGGVVDGLLGGVLVVVVDDERREGSADAFAGAGGAGGWRRGVVAGAVQSGVDGGAAQFLSEQTLIGVVGYYYQQLTGDSGSGAQLGDFESRVAGIGPQLGYFFPLGGSMAYLSLKGYYEFAAENRPEGWNAWVTVSMPLVGAASPQ